MNVLKKTSFITGELRRNAAQSVESRLQGLAQEMGIGSLECRWNLDQGWENAGPHRLDVLTGSSGAKEYLTEDMLLSFNDLRNDPAREQQLRRILDTLSQRLSY